MIELKNIRKSFGSKWVLRDANLVIEDGESVVILGRSGSGKSVALRHILGLLKPDAGEVYVDGLNVNRLSRARHLELLRNIGMLFQNSALWDSMTVFENVALALRRHRLYDSEEELRQRVHDCLEMVGLHESRGGIEVIGWKMPAELSGGMRKRVGLARAIAPQPKYMLYDEPTTGLDPIMAGIINRLINHLNREMKITSLTITHDLQSAYDIADRIVLLHYGRFRDLGTPEETRASTDEVVRQFIHGVEGPVHPSASDHLERIHAHH